jgi:hypothetical protein
VEFHVLDAQVEPLVVPHDFFDEAVVRVAPSVVEVQIEPQSDSDDSTRLVVAFSGGVEFTFLGAEFAVRVPFPQVSET